MLLESRIQKELVEGHLKTACSSILDQMRPRIAYQLLEACYKLVDQVRLDACSVSIRGSLRPLQNEAVCSG